MGFFFLFVFFLFLLVGGGSSGSQSGALCKTGYLSETYLKLKPSEVSFAHSLFLIDSIVFKCCTLHSGDTDVICAKYQKHVKTERDVMD